jgi:osmotically-inducible protein OsmY
VVQLIGFVDSAEKMQRAEEIARGVPGVKDVKNNLVLRGK